MSTSLDIDLGRQRLRLLAAGTVVREFKVSSARNGPGECRDSGCTPRGRHRIRAKIGAQAPAGAVFVGRRPTGEIYSAALAATAPDRDWILSRILWLGGLEPGLNRYGPVDTQSRFIYIHGTPEEDRLGEPVSHGCIRMSNADVMALYAAVPVNCVVNIHV